MVVMDGTGRAWTRFLRQSRRRLLSPVKRGLNITAMVIFVCKYRPITFPITIRLSLKQWPTHLRRYRWSPEPEITAPSPIDFWSISCQKYDSKESAYGAGEAFGIDKRDTIESAGHSGIFIEGWKTKPLYSGHCVKVQLYLASDRLEGLRHQLNLVFW